MAPGLRGPTCDHVTRWTAVIRRWLQRDTQDYPRLVNPADHRRRAERVAHEHQPPGGL